VSTVLAPTEPAGVKYEETIHSLNSPEMHAGDDSNTCRCVDEFVMHVIYDGRFIDSFTIEPDTVAAKLGLELAPEVAETVRGADPIEMLDRTNQTMTSDLMVCQSLDIGGGCPDVLSPRIVKVRYVIQGIQVAVSIVEIVKSETRVMVQDEAPDADGKL